MHDLVLSVSTVLATDPVPSDNDVKAGWVAFAVFLLLIAAVAFLCRSFVKQLRKVEKANDQGVYDEQPGDEANGLPPTHTRADS
jgi:hypothetical protein